MSPPPAPPARVLTVRRPLILPRDGGHRLLRVVRGWLVRRVLVMGAVLVLLCMVQVWLRLQVMHVGYDLSAARKVQLRLEHEQRELDVELATLRDPGRLEDIARKRLGMTDPAKGQVVVLP
jgi:cell division protein FtsL